MEMYQVLNEELVKEVQSMRRKIQELRTEIIRLQGEHMDKYTENVLMRKQVTKFMLNTCYRLVDMVEPNTDIHEQLGNMLLGQWQDNNGCKSPQSAAGKWQSDWKTESVSHGRGVKCSDGSVSTSSTTSGGNRDSLNRRRRSSSEFVEEFRRSSNLIQQEVYSRSNSPTYGSEDDEDLEQRVKVEESNAGEEEHCGEVSQELEENEESWKENTPSPINRDSDNVQRFCVLNQVILERSNESADEEDSDKSSPEELEKANDDEAETEDDVEHDVLNFSDNTLHEETVSVREGGGKDEDDEDDGEDDNDDSMENIPSCMPSLRSPQVLKECRNGSVVSIMDMSMDASKTLVARRSTNFNPEDMELDENSSWLGSKPSRWSVKKSDDGIRTWRNSKRKPKTTTKPSIEERRANHRSPLSTLNTCESAAAQPRLLINGQDMDLLTIDHSVETLRGALSSMDMSAAHHDITPLNHHQSTMEAKRSGYSFSPSCRMSPKSSSTASSKLANINDSFKKMQKSSMKGNDSNVTDDDIDENNPDQYWCNVTKASTASFCSTLSTSSTQCSQDAEEDVSMNSRPRRRCRPNSLAEPNLRIKLRDNTNTRNKKKCKR